MQQKSELPEGWTISRIENLIGDNGVFIDGDWVESKDQDLNGDVRLIQLADIKDGKFANKSRKYLTYETAQKLKCTFLEKGDILVARMPEPIGRACIFPGNSLKSVTAVDVCIIRTGESEIDHKWLMNLINSPYIRGEIVKLSKGTTRKRISRKNLASIELPLPPLGEQHRIVSAIEALFARLDAANEKLDRAPDILKMFRESVLAIACNGRLTEDWRMENPNVEDAYLILEKIKSFRMRLTLKQKVENGFDEEHNSAVNIRYANIPDTWSLCQIKDISLVNIGGTPSRKVESYWNGNLPWLSSGEIANCRITSTKEKITEEGLQNSNAKVYPPNTVLIAMIGEGKTRGQSAILDIHSSTNQNIAALLFDTDYVSPEYVWRWALGEYEHNRSVGRGGSQPALNGQKVRELIIPLPPLLEQQEIIRRVDALFAFTDSIESKVAAAKEKTEKLRQSILAKAFSGELVPTEAEIARREGRGYESGEALLERIKEGKSGKKTIQHRLDLFNSSSSPSKVNPEGD